MSLILENGLPFLFLIVLCFVVGSAGYFLAEDFFTRKSPPKTEVLIWTSRDGRRTYIPEMDYTHAINVRALLDKSAIESPWVKETLAYKAITNRIEVCEKEIYDKATDRP